MRRLNHEYLGLSNIIPVHASTAVPLVRQVYQGLQTAIVSGQLLGGSRLPSTRALAQELAISRTTVFLAYQQLALEGYLQGRHGSGTYVARLLPEETLAPLPPTLPCPDSQTAPLPSAASASASSSSSSAAFAPADLCTPAAFEVGKPALDAFPRALWQRLQFRRIRRSWSDLFSYQKEPAGYPPLREAIAAYLAVARGVRCRPEQVLVTAGAQTALNLAARLLVQPGEAVWIEDPGYFGARWALEAAGARLIPVPVDPTSGFDVTAAQELFPDARVAFVTPSHQFPLGATMSLTQRVALLDWAKTQQGWIIEDDYDSEYRYVGRPLPSMQGLDEAGRVLYLGTFSKVLYPSLRLGYLVLPPDLVNRFVLSHKRAHLHVSTFEQAVVADFMLEGYFVRHIRRMRTLYAQRQALLCAAIAQDVAGRLEVLPDPAGMHLTAWLPQDVDAHDVAQSARTFGVQVSPLSTCAIRPLRRSALLLGYAGTDEAAIHHGVQVLARVLAPSRTSLHPASC